MASASPTEIYLPARKVWQRYGVSECTIGRWVKDPRNDFPKPIYIGRFRYWKRDELEAWEARQAANHSEVAKEAA